MNQFDYNVPKKVMKLCPNGNCAGKTVKKGFQNQTQRCKCKLCNRNFLETYSYRAYDKATNAMMFLLLKEGCRILGIGRVLKIFKNTVLARILKISDRIRRPIFQTPLCIFGMEELYTYVGNKSVRSWITYAIERKLRKMLDFIVGNRSKIQISKQ